METKTLTPEEEAYLEKVADWQREEKKLAEYIEKYEPEEDLDSNENENETDVYGH